MKTPTWRCLTSALAFWFFNHTIWMRREMCCNVLYFNQRLTFLVSECLILLFLIIIESPGVRWAADVWRSVLAEISGLENELWWSGHLSYRWERGALRLNPLTFQCVLWLTLILKSWTRHLRETSLCYDFNILHRDWSFFTFNEAQINNLTYSL